MLPKISQYTKALRNKKLNFKKGKSVREGYNFDYNSGSLDELSMQKLRLWPSDKQISQTFHHSQHLARELAEFLGMIQPSTLLINNNTPTIFIDINDEENLHDNDESELSDDCEIDLSTAINKASSEIQKINEQLEENLENEEIFNDCYSQIQLLDKMTVMSILNGGDSVNNEFKYFINDDLNFESLINQRKLHEAYCSKPLERRFKPVGSNLNLSNNISIQPNKASHFVAYFTKNENPEQRFVTQREKRWKDNRKNLALTLAQLHMEELEKSRKKKMINKRKAHISTIQIPNIEDANITREFPLVKGHYVFVRYGDKMCIGRVISVYFEAYGKHCYTDEPVETINDISYISLHVYIPIYFNVFSDLVKEGCNILTHHIPSNIVYHISETKVLIDSNMLKLVGDEKKYYDEYFASGLELHSQIRSYFDNAKPYDAQYSPEHDVPYLWWNSIIDGKFSSLSRLSKVIFSITPHSASCERLFSSLGWMFGKKRTNLSAQTIESMAKIYRYNLSTKGQKSLNHADLISNNDVQQMLNNVFEEGDLFNESDDDEELIPNEGNEVETSDVDEILDIENVVDLGPWVLIDNTTLPIVTRRRCNSDDEDDEDWNPDEI
ncbi:hypothetical protein RhiirA5_437211 [Rhizophagus irregularis]|uniref:HAT C-terminal dimerisation domain-containing protein n=3 Tax=Rhizophagus irregularis TaxID=588596 RepID=A0A2N0NKT9_9GLOM|nr:hypothetical protein RhiirA5_437211 [Rhizophagus irregularis]